mmetsp:Transcript_32802/g.76583  ORF Transcript_32802/g.76583 Transcript_32802/m.76583 type:complete len:206 (+) Transcript_32802:466-1083(+)
MRVHRRSTRWRRATPRPRTTSSPSSCASWSSLSIRPTTWTSTHPVALPSAQSCASLSTMMSENVVARLSLCCLCSRIMHGSRHGSSAWAATAVAIRYIGSRRFSGGTTSSTGPPKPLHTSTRSFSRCGIQGRRALRLSITRSSSLHRLGIITAAPFICGVANCASECVSCPGILTLDLSHWMSSPVLNRLTCGTTHASRQSICSI